MKKLTASLALIGATVLPCAAQSTGFNLFDDSFTFFNGAQQVNTGLYEVRWGTYSGEVFTPFFGTAATISNDGYLGDPFGAFEIYASITTADNTVIPLNTSIYLAITLLPNDANYTSGSLEVILTDPSWKAPTFVLAGDPLDVSFTASTTAVKGNFSFNAGNEIITIATAAIPEPSSFAALTGIGIMGFIATRRRRSA